MPNEFPYDVFLSHRSQDKEVVRGVAERLRKDGLKVWFDEWVLKPGDSVPAKIEEGLEHSRVLVLCMSANAFGSDWARLEAGTFRFRDPLNKERRFIPLRLDDAPIKGPLSQFVYIDWRPADHEREYSKLLDACRQEVAIDLAACEFAGMRIVAHGTAYGGETVVMFHRTGDATTTEGRRYWCSGFGRVVGNAWEVRIECLRDTKPDHRYLLAVLCTEADTRHIIEAAESKSVDSVFGLMDVIGHWVVARSKEVLVKRTGKPAS